jgi:hypothetical protein
VLYCAGLWVQLLSWCVEKIDKKASVDTTCCSVSLWRGGYGCFCRFCEQLPGWLKWQSRWGYFHVGQALLLDTEWAEPKPTAGSSTPQPKKFLDAESFGSKHNLEVRQCY